MSARKLTVPCVGASGSVGRHVVEQAPRRGHAVRALVRDPAKAAGLPPQADIVVGDLPQPDALAQAAAGVDAIVVTHGSGGDKADTRAVDHGGVRNDTNALDGVGDAANMPPDREPQEVRDDLLRLGNQQAPISDRH